jgi:hypothetical protein
MAYAKQDRTSEDVFKMLSRPSPPRNVCLSASFELPQKANARPRSWHGKQPRAVPSSERTTTFV